MFRRTLAGALPIGFVLIAPATAAASLPGMHVVSSSIIGSIFGSIGHLILGAFSWTAGVASKFLLTILAGFVKLLIPQSWINQGLSVMEWIVAVPDYAGTVSTPGGGHTFGFAGINDLRELFMWLGLAVAPLALTYATSRALVDESEPVAAPLARVLGLGVVVASYGYWWRQAAALADQITHAILTLPEVSQGLYKLMEYAVGGVALGGWQLIDLALMGAIGLELLGLIFLKVVLILCGALLYATGPLMIGLAATRSGHALARAWASAAAVMFGLGIVWAALFAVGALLINDAGSAGPLIAGNSTFGSLMGGLLLALAGLASLWTCLKVAREAAGLLRMQLASAFAAGRVRGGASSTSLRSSSAVRTTGRSLSGYGARLAAGASAAGGELVGAIPGGANVSRRGQSVRQVGRCGLGGTAAAAARAGARRSAPRVERAINGSRVGAVAVKAARAGASGWGAAAVAAHVGAPGTPRMQGKPTAPRPDTSRPGGSKRKSPAPKQQPPQAASVQRSESAPRPDDASAPSQARFTTTGRSVRPTHPTHSSSTTGPSSTASRITSDGSTRPPQRNGAKTSTDPGRMAQEQPRSTANGAPLPARSSKPAAAVPSGKTPRRGRAAVVRPWRKTP